jgi:oligopeptide transport system substrate-binding protein
VFESGSEPGSLDPAQSMLDAETYVQAALFEGLTGLHPVTCAPIAALATHYEAAQTSTRFTFYLRGHAAPRGIRLEDNSDLPEEYSRGRVTAHGPAAALWSDGARITAEDFAYAWRRMKDPATAAYLAPVYFASIRDARALDEFTFQVDLSEPNPIFVQFLWLPAFAAVPRHAIEAATSAGRASSWTEPRRMVSSGPFVLDQWLPKDRIVLRRNPLYYDAAAVSLDELVFLPTVDGATLVNLYKSGTAQITDVRVIPHVYVPVVAGARDARRSDGCRSVWFSVNTTQPPLDNVLVRYALNMSIDRTAIARALGGERIPARGYVPPIAGYSPPVTLPLPLNGQRCDILSFNPEAARTLIANTARTGRIRIAFTFPQDAVTKQLGEIVARQWRTVLDIDCSLSVQERSAYWSQTCLMRSYQGVVRDEWTPVVADPYDFLLQFGPAQYACAAWADKTYDRMLASANSTLNPAERMHKLADVETYLLRQMPLFPLYYDSWSSLQKPYVRGFPLSRLGWQICKYAWIDTKWRPA